MTESAPQPEPTPSAVTAAVVDSTDADAPSYAMFRIADLGGDTLFLAGPIFFEQGEEFTVELSRAGRDSLRLRARVVGIERGARPGMTVELRNLGETQRKALADLAAGD